MKTSTRFLLIALVTSAGISGARGQEPQPASRAKIAVIDLAKAFEAHPDTKAATGALTREREKLREIFKEKSNGLKETLQKHQELIRAGKKTEAAELLKKANQQEKEIATLRTIQQRDLEEKFRKTKHRILDAIRKVVTETNAGGKYAVILDKSAQSAFGVPAVIDASGAEDITEAIIAKLKAVPAEEKKGDE